MQKKYIDTLFEVGLSVNEAKVYLALLEKGISQVGEIVTISEVPQQRMYYVLEKLLNKGLCSLIPGKVKKYKPAEPSIGIGNFINKTKKQVDMLQGMVITLEEQYERAQQDNESFQHVEIIKNPNQIIEKMLSFERLAKTEVLSFNRAPYAMSKRNEEEINGMKEGIVYRSIYEVSEVCKLINRSVMEMYMEAGEEVRITLELPMKMMIFDDKVLIFSIEDHIIPGTAFSIEIIQRSNLIKSMKELFEVYWQKSMTVEEFKEKYKGCISLEAKSN